MAQTTKPILVTGAGGGVGSVSGIIVDLLRKQNISVRALVRRDDHRAQALRERGAEVIIGDLTQLPDVHRANPHLYHWAKSAVAEHDELRIPFGSGRIPPIAAYDVARVAAVILTNPAAHIGKSYDLTGPKAVNMDEVANIYSAVLGRKIRYVPLDWNEWKDTTLKEHVLKDGWEQHTADHLANLAQLIQKGTVEVSPNVELLTGSPGMDYEQW
ncbi:unnamed protein product, partial [Rotaria sp. Silwood1]